MPRTCLIKGIRRIFSTGSIQQKETGGFVIIDKQVISAGQFGLACYFGCPVNSHCVNDICRCNDGFIGNTFEGCAGKSSFSSRHATSTCIFSEENRRKAAENNSLDFV